MKKYGIGDRTFYIKKLVLVQTRHLMKELAKLGVNSTELNANSENKASIMSKILDITGDGMSRILSCILTEEGKLFPKGEEFEKLIDFIDNNVDMETVNGILVDFLALSQTVIVDSSSVKKDNSQ